MALAQMNVLRQAPLEIQKILGAFKGATHPKEDPKTDFDAKMIRHHFFDGAALPNRVSDELAMLLTVADTEDPKAGAEMYLQMVLKDALAYPELSVDGIDLTMN